MKVDIQNFQKEIFVSVHKMNIFLLKMELFQLIERAYKELQCLLGMGQRLETGFLFTMAR